MDRIEINLDAFNKLKPIKKGIVHLHRNKLYKHSPDTLEIVTAIDSFRTNPVFQRIAAPTAYLYDKKQYFGYAMNYYRKLKQVDDAIKSGIIVDIEKFSLELISIIDELNKLNLCYWDIHYLNVLSDPKGHPFILDIDDIELIPSNEDLHDQRQYLTEFILSLYLGIDKSIHQLAREEVIQKYFKDKTLMYIDTLGDLKEPVPDLPYCIIEELHDQEKRDMIKSKII